MALVLLAFLWSLMQGPEVISPFRLAGALFAGDGSRDQLVVQMIRLPRSLAGALAGAALATAGAICQAMTGNPLASPGILGINAGAAFAVVAAISLVGVTDPGLQLWCAFGGAALATVLVWMLGRASGAPVIGLVLSGAVLAGFLSALTTVLLIFDQGTLDQVRLWTAGSLHGRNMGQVLATGPFILAGLVLSFLMRRHIMTLSLGAELAQALGQDLRVWRGLALALVVLTAGGAVALAGPVGFVGLMVPNLVRLLVGPDYRRIIPASALGGAALLLLADTTGRWISGNESFPAGITMALLGGPFFIALARRRAGGRA
ncbi:iron ABC transporter permease [Xinfangfangia sp. D13-10-4-6]|uniref:FecCD family ABC transporter permease n=1 Tax=Pseudogemmobacter hezensis TaxID=2737662 RepID=UPI00155565DD|nr:iron ABC transporter permease [Pseudogemmobacter hezensis]NPD17424.1 iron ABC transporter permease [Pseudogemmobacter hezensis]